MDYRQKIIDELDALRKKEVQEKQVFKARAYAKVITNLKALDQRITSMDDIEGIPGIGESIRAKIEEILVTGSLEAAKVARQENKLEAIDAIMNIYGIGPVKAKQLVKEYSVKDIPHLREIVNANPKLLNAKQKIGLKYAEDLMLRIPRTEMEEHEALLESQIPKGFNMRVVGSYRRGASTSGDIDVLLCAPKMSVEVATKEFAMFCQKLQDAEYMKDILALGPKKCMGVCQLRGSTPARRIDLLMTPKDEYAYAELYFTGSEKFNIAMRQHALDRGYTMNEHGMKPVKEGVPVPPTMKTEKDIFKFLDYPYVAPTKRDVKKNL